MEERISSEMLTVFRHFVELQKAAEMGLNECTGIVQKLYNLQPADSVDLATGIITRNSSGPGNAAGKGN